LEANDVLSGAYGHALTEVAEVLKGLSREDLDWQPHPDSNSIGWLVWHMAREQDAVISFLTLQKQIWISEGWHDKFNRPADPKDYGTGQTQEQVASFRSPDVDILLEYYAAVVKRSQEYIVSLTETDLDQIPKIKLMEPPPTVGSWLAKIMDDCMQHAGQAGYVRGLWQGLGWQKY
jgi:hypothetical protein